MSLKRTVAPTELPISLDEVKDHLRYTASDQDAPLMAYIRAVVEQLDGAAGLLNRALVTQTWEWKFKCFPNGDVFRLPLPPLQSVTSVQYVDTNGDTQTFAASKYNVLDTDNPTRQGRIELAYGEVWPTVRDQAEAVTVTFVAGYGARNDVPEYTRSLILLLVADAFRQREAVNVGSAMSEMPAVGRLINIARFGGIY